MSSNHSGLSGEIAELFSSRLGIETPSVETDLFDTGILDSMAFVELLLQLESSFGLKLNLSEIEFEQFRSVEKIADFVASKVMKTVTSDK